jgi:hypothetical protein
MIYKLKIPRIAEGTVKFSGNCKYIYVDGEWEIEHYKNVKEEQYSDFSVYGNEIHTKKIVFGEDKNETIVEEEWFDDYYNNITEEEFNMLWEEVEI